MHRKELIPSQEIIFFESTLPLVGLKSLVPKFSQLLHVVIFNNHLINPIKNRYDLAINLILFDDLLSQLRKICKTTDNAQKIESNRELKSAIKNLFKDLAAIKDDFLEKFINHIKYELAAEKILTLHEKANPLLSKDLLIIHETEDKDCIISCNNKMKEISRVIANIYHQIEESKSSSVNKENLVALDTFIQQLETLNTKITEDDNKAVLLFFLDIVKSYQAIIELKIVKKQLQVEKLFSKEPVPEKKSPDMKKSSSALSLLFASRSSTPSSGSPSSASSTSSGRSSQPASPLLLSSEPEEKKNRMP